VALGAGDGASGLSGINKYHTEKKQPGVERKIKWNGTGEPRGSRRNPARASPQRRQASPGSQHDQQEIQQKPRNNNIQSTRHPPSDDLATSAHVHLCVIDIDG